MDMNKSMTGDYLVFSDSIRHFLFEDLKIHSTTGIVVACLVVGAMTLLLEGGKSLMLYIQLRMKQNPLTYGRTSTSTSIQSDRSPLFSALMIPSSISQIRQQRIQYHIFGYLLHTFNLIIGYLLMLAVMSYNAYVMVAVIVGSGFGYYIFGAVNYWNQAKFALLRSNIYERYDSQVALASQQTEEIH